jgi:FlaA1/EpsC-like NDP-sugar epimerase
MGATKRVAEMIGQRAQRDSDTQYITIRFGNVLGSSGSVIPLFKKQIANGGPLTVTHPDIKRYFMSISEASQLVIQAATYGKGGEIFILDMGEPIKIVDLAKQMITASGLIEDRDIKIEFVGLRPGEKLYEELLYSDEEVLSTDHPKVKVAKLQSPEQESFDELINKLLVSKPSEVQLHLQGIVPEYQPGAQS